MQIKRETYEICLYINSHSYFIARYLLEKSILMLHCYLCQSWWIHPNDAYMETFVFFWLVMVSLILLLSFSPKFFRKYDDNDAKNRFWYDKDKALESAISTNNIEFLQNLWFK